MTSLHFAEAKFLVLQQLCLHCTVSDQTMDIEDFFQEWDEDDFADLLEDNERAMNTVEAEDNEDE